jgi:transglutaminase-like putative cysteine protease
MTLLHVRHTTTYRYRAPVKFGEHRWLFRPRDSQEQRLVDTKFEVIPEPASLHWVHDVFGNCVAVVNFSEPADRLRFASQMILDHTPDRGPRFLPDESAYTWPFVYDETNLPDLAAYRRVHYPDSTVEAWAKGIIGSDGNHETEQLLANLTKSVRERCSYNRRLERGTQKPAITLEKRSGTCRDFALLMIEAARYLGFAARFVTGYIYVPARDTPKMLGGGATHAWVQIFLPGAGWVEFDPTNGIIGSKDLIRVGVARDSSQARPLSGTFEGPSKSYLGMDVEVQVQTEAKQRDL